jgi:hypothetical protein
MDHPPVRPSQNDLSFHWDKLCAPLCAQCRSRMTIVLMRAGLR